MPQAADELYERALGAGDIDGSGSRRKRLIHSGRAVDSLDAPSGQTQV